MKPFEVYLRNNEVRKVTININEARSLFSDAQHRFDYYTSLIKSDTNAKFIFENIYESLRELLDTILIYDGFKSYSHQASIVYIRDNKVITDKEAIMLDEFRELRNKLKYSGEKINLMLSEEYISEMKLIFETIKSYIKKTYIK